VDDALKVILVPSAASELIARCYGSADAFAPIRPFFGSRQIGPI
jgi:hypothetical protein